MNTLVPLLFAFLALSSCAIHPPYWTEISQHGDVPAPISDGSGTFVEGFGFFVFGGLTGSANTVPPADNPTNTFHVFDPSTSTWTDLSSFPNGPSARAESMLWPTDSGIGLAGGRGPFRRGLDLTHNDTYQFVVNGGWVSLGESVHANRSTEAAVDVRKGSYTAYAFSGSSSTLGRFVNRVGGLRTDVVTYSPTEGWNSVALHHSSPVPTPRAHHCWIANDNGKSMFTYGGYTADPTGVDVFGAVNFLGDLWEYKTKAKKFVNHTWTGADPGHRDNSKLFYDASHDRLWLVGGQNEIGPIMDVWFYSFPGGLWVNVTPYLVGGVMPPARVGTLFFTQFYEDRIEFTIFSGGDPPLNDMWKLTVPLNFSI